MTHTIMAWLPIVTILFVLFVQTDSCATSDVHSEATSCRNEFTNEQMSDKCRSVCAECHESTEPIYEFDIYGDGDTDICIKCHESKVMIASNNLLLKKVQGGGGNHRVQIFYDVGQNGTKLKDDPQGVKLFRDANGDFPKVHCSSCHNAMSNNLHLLRISNMGSSLCLACHAI